MGFSISDLNPVSLISNAAESICDSVLPENMEFVGDLVGMSADVQSGNWLKCLEDFQDLVQDLPQQVGQRGSSPAGADGPGASTGGQGDDLATPSFLEPTPPAPYGAATNSTSTTTTTVVTTTNGSPSTDGPAADAAESSGRPNPTGVNTPWDLSRFVLDHIGAQATPSPAAAPSVGNASGPSPTATGSSSIAEPSNSTATPAPGEPTSASSTSTTATDPFFELSDAELMERVTSGQIPESVTKDPAKMQQLQARMNQISEMNQLISQMMAAIHDMLKSVIQNIRA